MSYISDLPHSVDTSWVDNIYRKSDDTIIYITIAGPWQVELEEALDCLYLDNKRSFELIQLKKEQRYIGACIAMKPQDVRANHESLCVAHEIKREETK
jgi:hypothetical protein